MPAPRLTTYRFRVFAGNPDDPEMYELATFGRDVQRTEKLFAERGWGATTSRPMTSAAVVCYFAMHRLGHFDGDWEAFEEWYLSIEPVEPVNADPINAGPEPALQLR